MKTFLKKMIGAAGAALLVAGSVQTSQAGSADPSAGGSFTWDLQSAGSGQRGIAMITFNSDNTFRGYQLLAATPPKDGTNTVNDGRPGGSGNGGRGGSGGSNGKTNNYVFGFGPIDGAWTLNSRGQIVGFFSEPINVTSTVTNYHANSLQVNLLNAQTAETTNIVITFTNGQASLTTNFVWATPTVNVQQYTFANSDFTIDVASAETTNTVSFVGKAVANKRLTLLCSTTFGQVSMKGKPAAPSIDLSGTWIGTKRENGLQTTEFFSLQSAQTINPFPAQYPDVANFPNIFFTTDGIGATYGFTGAVIFSQGKMVGFTFFKSDGTMSSSIGNLRVTKFGPTANATGIDEPLNRLNFTATLQ